MSAWITKVLPVLLQELIISLLRLVLFLIVWLIRIFVRLWEIIKSLLHTGNLFPEETEEDCGEIPDPFIRRPDPCIYSQTYLMAQGLPVTWDNPDIWVAPAANPGAIEPDSFHLKDDTDYIVSVQVHNASTDPAIGVKVRLVYRPWSFNSPDLTPVETDASGNEVFRFVDIGGMGAAITQFAWHTPKLQPGESAHFCLQAHVSHPMDTNLGNNMGQENTNVFSQNPGFVSPGEIADIEVPLFNLARRAQTVAFRWDAYQINTADQVELRLKVAHGTPNMPLGDRLGHILPRVEYPKPPPPPPPPPPPIEITAAASQPPPRISAFGRLVFDSSKSAFRATKTKYEGFESLQQVILGRDYSLPAGMTVTVLEPVPLMGFQEERKMTFRIQVPPDAPPDTRIPVNLVAQDEAGALIGGVSVFFHVRP